MSLVATLNTFWAANLNGVLPVGNLHFGLAPSNQTTYPYAVVKVISQVPTYVTGGTHLEAMRWQVTLWSQSLVAVNTLADQVEAVLDQSKPDNSALINRKLNRLPLVHVNGQTATYSITLEYLWDTNAA